MDDTFSLWMGLADGLGADLAEASIVYWTVLHRRYSEGHRSYHTMDHVVRCLLAVGMDAWRVPDNTSLRTVQLALWFHDVVYDPVRKDNEARSSDVLVGSCALMGVDSAVSRNAAYAVLRTVHSGERMVDPVTAAVLDADLSSLGASWETFEQDSANIRREYSHVPDEAWRTGRRAVLSDFLDRAVLYHTPGARDLFDHQARENMRRAVKELDG